MENLSELYKNRFESAGLAKRNNVWAILCKFYFNRYIRNTDSVLEVACGYGEFINNIDCAQKYAVDINADSAAQVAPDVTFVQASAETIADIDLPLVDVVFVSNFLEHLRSKADLERFVGDVQKRLKPGGRFLILGPNFKYAYKDYWDFIDHHLPLSHLSLSELLVSSGYSIETMVPKFLPFSMGGRLPAAPILVKLYLRLPFFWTFFGKQFFIVARKS